MYLSQVRHCYRANAFCSSRFRAYVRDVRNNIMINTLEIDTSNRNNNRTYGIRHNIRIAYVPVACVVRWRG